MLKNKRGFVLLTTITLAIIVLGIGGATWFISKFQSLSLLENPLAWVFGIVVVIYLIRK